MRRGGFLIAMEKDKEKQKKYEGRKLVSVSEKESLGDKKKTKDESTGSRWAALVVLMVTVLFGVGFYLMGSGLTLPDLKLPVIGGSKTFVIE
jgi:hypothetical protein